MFLAIGIAAGALPLSGAEPGGAYVDCGPAVFGRPSPLPDPACSAAYTPLPQLTVVLFAAATLAIVAAVAIQIRPRRLPPRV